MYSPADAAQQRLSHCANAELRRDVLEALHELLLSTHVHAQSYKLMYDTMCAHPQSIASMAMQLRIESSLAATIQRARWRPTTWRPSSCSPRGAAVDGEVRRTRLIVADRRDGHGLQFLPSHSSLCDPLIYPLLFASGDSGWIMGVRYSHARRVIPSSAAVSVDGEVDEIDGELPDLEHKYDDAEVDDAPIDAGGGDADAGRAGLSQRNRLTMQQFYRWRLACRSLTPSPTEMIYYCARLTQQYIVDAFAKIEESRLLFLRRHQDRLRAETYGGLQDWMHRAGDGASTSEQMGRHVILPSSFTGGPRSMYQHYQDAMSIVRRFGCPDLFITFTCNPNWPEIVLAITPPQTRSERPDVVARVFALKLRAFMTDLRQRQCFGVVLAYTSVIEFQKRGLPHAHIMLTLADEHKPRDTTAIDRMVSAELPDPSVVLSYTPLSSST